jgi:hypothetical protein
MKPIAVLLTILTLSGWASARDYFGIHPIIGSTFGAGIEYTTGALRFSLDVATGDGATVIGPSVDFINRIAPLSPDKSSFFYAGAGVFVAYAFNSNAGAFAIAPRALAGVEWLFSQPEIAFYLEPQIGYIFFLANAPATFYYGLQFGVNFR